MTKFILLLLLAGCQTVTNTDRVVYEDGTPVKHVEVKIQNNSFKGNGFTDIHGQWAIPVPPGEEVQLCIEEIQRGIGNVCYQGELYTPETSGGLIAP